ncbi:hypothetical protein NW759_017055 [Fusarium solani]|nr:hypothetical protein NW759_017055 [Fusarium solani]
MAAYAAPSHFQPHRAREAIRDAHKKKIPPILGYYAGLSALSPTRLIGKTRLIATMNFDAVYIDWARTSCNVGTMTSMVHEAIFMSQGRTIPWVRVPGHDHAAIGYALDAGASIVIPQYGTKQNGTRSVPPFRLVPMLMDHPCHSARDIYKGLNDQAAIMIQIESVEGVNNLDAILTEVPDIDVVWLGSLDAHIGMNVTGNMGTSGEEQEWLDAREKFFATIDKHDKPYSGFAFVNPPYGSPEALKQAAEKMSMIIMTTDMIHLAGMAQDLAQSRKVVGFPERNRAQKKNGTRED